MNKRIVSTLTALLLFGSTSHAGEIMDSAERAVRANRENADQWAEHLAQSDFEQAFTEITKQIQTVDKSPSLFTEFLQGQKALQTDLESFSNQSDSVLDLNASKLGQLREQYDDLVRRRFDLSWVPTQIAEQYRQLGPLLTQIAQRYDETCKMGRSDVKFDSTIPAEPPPPPYYYEVMVSMNGGPYPTASYRGLNYRRENKTRSDIISGSGAVASISGSILANAALDGAAGASATLTAASYAFPVASAVLVTALVVEHFENMAEANKIFAEVAAAEDYKFTQTKRDDYIREQYTHICGERAKRLARVAQIVSTLEAGGAPAEALIKKEEERVAEIADLQARIAKAGPARCRLSLAERMKEKACVAPGADAEARAKAVCQTDGHGLVQLMQDGFPECRIQFDDKKGYANAKEDRTLVDAVKHEEVEDMTLHNLVLLLGKNRADFITGASQASWKAVDEATEAAFSRLLKFINLARRMNERGLNAATQPIRDEIAARRTFEGLRGRFIDVVATAVKVSFNKLPRTAFDQEFQSFQTDFAAFYQKTRSNRESQWLDSAQRELKGIMNGRAK